MGQPPGEPAAPSPLQPERFVWPPRPVPPGPTPARAAHSCHTALSINDASAPARPLDPRTPAGRATGLWSRIEETWLGLAVPPLHARAAAAGWVPDEIHAYCPRCGTTVGRFEADDVGCRVCRTRKVPWERFIRIGPYEGLLRQMIVEVKFTRWRRLGHGLGLLLGRQIAQTAASAPIDPQNAVLVPMPTSFRRRLSRGIDHALVVARGASEASGLPLSRSLDRLHRPSQRSVTPSRRRSNVAGSFRLRPGSGLEGRTIIVVDDVRTTGATMAAACRAIRHGLGPPSPGEPPARLWAAVLGVTPEPGGERHENTPSAASG